VGVYVKANGDTIDDTGFTVPAPLSVMVTLVAVPPKVLPLTVTGAIPQVLPVKLPSVSAGGLIHPHDTTKIVPTVVQPAAFLTDIK
jgi:hypothetical protein